MSHLKSSIINFSLFQIGWFACALGIGNDWPALTFTVLGIVLTLHLYLSKHRQRDLLFLILAGLIGTVIDSSLGWFGVLIFNGHWFCPLWLTGLWMVFSSTIHYSLSWLRSKLMLGAFFGAIGGPLSYYAGAKFGALQLNENTILALAVIAATWAIVTPLLLFISNQSLRIPSQKIVASSNY